MDDSVKTVTEEVSAEASQEEATPVVEETVEAPVVEEPADATAMDDKAADATSEMKPVEEKKAPRVVPADAKWFIVHTYSGHENKVARGVQQRAETMGFTDKIFDIIVPTREITKVSQGKKQQVNEKIFPGYVLVRMVLTDETWLLVRTTQGVTAFIGAGNKPTPISEKEVEAIQKFMKLEEPLYKAAFTTGEAVKIVDGPFADFLGTIESIDEAKGKLRVLVSIFGRETPVELDFLQVAKI